MASIRFPLQDGSHTLPVQMGNPQAQVQPVGPAASPFANVLGMWRSKTFSDELQDSTVGDAPFCGTVLALWPCPRSHVSGVQG